MSIRSLTTVIALSALVLAGCSTPGKKTTVTTDVTRGTDGRHLLKEIVYLGDNRYLAAVQDDVEVHTTKLPLEPYTFSWWDHTLDRPRESFTYLRHWDVSLVNYGDDDVCARVNFLLVDYEATFPFPVWTFLPAATELPIGRMKHLPFNSTTQTYPSNLVDATWVVDTLDLKEPDDTCINIQADEEYLVDTVDVSESI